MCAKECDEVARLKFGCGFGSDQPLNFTARKTTRVVSGKEISNPGTLRIEPQLDRSEV